MCCKCRLHNDNSGTYINTFRTHHSTTVDVALLLQMVVSCKIATWRGKGRPIVKYRDILLWAVQNTRTDQDVLWDVDSRGFKEACIRWVHTGKTWQIRLNCPCVAAMRPFCQITLTTCFTLILLFLGNSIGHKVYRKLDSIPLWVMWYIKKDKSQLVISLLIWVLSVFWCCYLHDKKGVQSVKNSAYIFKCTLLE